MAEVKKPSGKYWCVFWHDKESDATKSLAFKSEVGAINFARANNGIIKPIHLGSKLSECWPERKIEGVNFLVFFGTLRFEDTASDTQIHIPFECLNELSDWLKAVGEVRDS